MAGPNLCFGGGNVEVVRHACDGRQGIISGSKIARRTEQGAYFLSFYRTYVLLVLVEVEISMKGLCKIHQSEKGPCETTSNKDPKCLLNGEVCF